MKKTLLTLFALSSLTSFAQERKLNFDKKLSYKIETQNSEDYLSADESVYLVWYQGKDALLGITEGGVNFLNNGIEAFLSIDKKVYDVASKTIENRLSIVEPYYFMYSLTESEFPSPYRDSFLGNVKNFERLGTQTTINGFTCNNFRAVESYSYMNSVVNFCIDESSSTDNASFILPNQNIKGKIIQISDESLKLTLDSEHATQVSFTFDAKKAEEEFYNSVQKTRDEYQKLIEEEVYTEGYEGQYEEQYEMDPLYNNYEYQTTENSKVNYVLSAVFSNMYFFVESDYDYDGQIDIERKKGIEIGENLGYKIIDQYKKLKFLNKEETKLAKNQLEKFIKDLKEFVPNKPIIQVVEEEPASEIDSYPYGLENSGDYTYQSNYKDLNLDNLDFAYTAYMSDEYYRNLVPKFCYNLSVPEFDSKELKANVHNYIGQLCDFYISNHVYNVGIVETTDALRYSLLKINELKPKLSEKDQKLYDNFIKNLD